MAGSPRGRRSDRPEHPDYEPRGRSPWARTRTGELADPLLPRWFVLLALVAVAAAAAAAVAAFLVFTPADVGVAERRPPPAGGLTTGVGDLVVGDRPAAPVDGLCPTLDGVRTGGTAVDRAVLRDALEALCALPRLPADTGERLARFARAGGTVRFAQFAATGVDSTADLDAEPPQILVNARFARTEPAWIAPLLVHDTTYLDAEPGTAAGALAARRAEADICDRLFADRRPSRGCDDAAALLAMPDPLGALIEAGFAG